MSVGAAPECPVCFEPFDKNHVPLVETSCGNSICELCLAKLKSCPLCRESLPREKLPRNITLIQLIERMDKPSSSSMKSATATASASSSSTSPLSVSSSSPAAKTTAATSNDCVQLFIKLILPKPTAGTSLSTFWETSKDGQTISRTWTLCDVDLNKPCSDFIKKASAKLEYKNGFMLIHGGRAIDSSEQTLYDFGVRKEATFMLKPNGRILDAFIREEATLMLNPDRRILSLIRNK